MRHRLHEIQARRQNPQRAASRASARRGSAPRVDAFEREFDRQSHWRKRALRRFTRVTRRDNIWFDGLARVSHVTDATDWRVEYPFVVVNPDTEEEVAAVVRACASNSGSRSFRAAAAPATRAARFR